MLRRQFLSSSIAASLIAPAALAQQRDLGAMKITSLSDGHLTLPRSFAFDGLPEAELAEILARHGVSSEALTPPCNVTLMQDGTRNVLFDTGAGSGFMPSAGALFESLEATGLGPEDITHIVFTHAHPDHIGGILDDFDDLAFPDAEYMIGQTEWDYWRDPNTVDTIGDTLASFAVGAARRLSAIEDRCTVFAGNQEILPGVMAHASFGHTPGHMAFELRSGNDTLMIIGDAIVNGHVAFERPDWPSGSDQDSEAGIATRLRLLDMLATDGTPILGYHLPGGGLGHVERRGDGFHFTVADA